MVKDHLFAFAFEQMNEPMTIRRRWQFETSMAVADAILGVVPDASISISDIGESTVFPVWLMKLTGFRTDLPRDITQRIKNSNSFFYAWHYGKIPEVIQRMEAVSELWNVPTFGTELTCAHFDAAIAAGISRSYWHYSMYCNTGPAWATAAFGNLSVPSETFGACILGDHPGDSSMCVPPALKNKQVLV